MASALKQFGLEGSLPLDTVAAKHFGGRQQAQHEIQLLKRRLRYAASAPAPRRFPETGADGWLTRDYVAWFEKANHLKRTT